MIHSYKWWNHCAAIKRYMPEQDQKNVYDIIKELPVIKKQGYQAIQITAPYLSVSFEPWWGLRPLDYFKPNRFLAESMEEFQNLVQKVHEYGMKIMIFMNLGYDDLASQTWKMACWAKKHAINKEEKHYFLWSDTGKEPLLQMADSHFLQGGTWVYSENAQSYYWSKWREGEIQEPQFNWSDLEFQKYMKRILHFWLRTGIDGVIVDAVNWYLNCNMKILKNCVTDVIHSYPGVCCIAEGSTGFGDPYLSWVKNGGFDIIEDQTFHSDLHWNGSAIMDAIMNNNASQIIKRLKTCIEARRNNIICWSYLSWDGLLWTPERRLIEIALLIATGHMVEIIPSYIKDLTKEQMEKLNLLISISKHDCFDPISHREYYINKNEQGIFKIHCIGQRWEAICEFDFIKENAYHFNIKLS